MRFRRETARGVLLLLFMLGLAAGSASASAAKQAATPAKPAWPLVGIASDALVPRLLFPVVGPSTFMNDFGAPRGSGRHEGIDIMAPKKSIAVAVEPGEVSFWTTSARAGCMLYLHGDSGTTYLYIHLNNDRTMGDDNRGGCKSGVTFAAGLKSGERVAAGQPVAYVGDSGDADGIASHLHFEVHPGGRGAVSGYPHLRRAQKLLFAPAPGVDSFKLTMQGTVVEVAAGSVELDVDRLRRYPGGLSVTKVDRTVELAVSPETVVFNPVGALIAGAQLARAVAGKDAVVWTQTQETTLAAQLGAPLALTAEKISLDD